VEWFVWGGVALTIASILVAFIVQHNREEPVARVEQPAARGGPLPVLFEVPDFSLTNQLNQVVRRADLEGALWIADIIFTRCAGPCPEMTRRMEQLQRLIPATESVKFVTLTTDPEYDTPTVLKAYARRFSADPARWSFLTGSKPQIFDLAVRGLKLTAEEKEEEDQQDPNDLFVHSTLLVLVDKQARARRVFESTAPDMSSNMMHAINMLLSEK
jgi:protein SCO1/2